MTSIYFLYPEGFLCFTYAHCRCGSSAISSPRSILGALQTSRPCRLISESVRTTNLLWATSPWPWPEWRRGRTAPQRDRPWSTSSWETDCHFDTFFLFCFLFHAIKIGGTAAAVRRGLSNQDWCNLIYCLPVMGDNITAITTAVG